MQVHIHISNYAYISTQLPFYGLYNRCHEYCHSKDLIVFKNLRYEAHTFSITVLWAATRR